MARAISGLNGEEHERNPNMQRRYAAGLLTVWRWFTGSITAFKIPTGLLDVDVNFNSPRP